MKGKLVSYVASKKYGFIQGNDNESYFFHVSSLNNKTDEVKLIKGVIMDFDCFPTPKGLTAKKITILEVYLGKKLVDFFTTKTAEIKRGTVEVARPIATCFYRDPNKARSVIERLAKEVGANAVLNLQIEKDTFSEGNYQYTVHAFRGHLAIVTDKAPVESEFVKEQMDQKVIDKLAGFETQYPIVFQRETEARRRQFESGCLKLIKYICIIFVVLFLLKSCL